MNSHGLCEYSRVARVDSGVPNLFHSTRFFVMIWIGYDVTIPDDQSKSDQQIHL